MKKSITFIIIILMLLIMHTSLTAQEKNPFFTEWKTPFMVPPFEQIKNEHYITAFEEGMRRHKTEIDLIANSGEKPTFENTIAALDYSGEMLQNVSSVFFNMTSANTSSELQNIAAEIRPKLSMHYDDIYFNDDLFLRVKEVYAKKHEISLSTEQMMLLELTYKNFLRKGAQLSQQEKKRLRDINARLTELTLKFSNNLLAETNNFELIIDKKEDLSGLPAALIESAAETAKLKNKTGVWIFTLHNSNVMPFLQFADNRELRRQIKEAYIRRGNNDNEYDNKEIIKEIVSLRFERAQLLGYKNHAYYALEMNMLENPETVFNLLDKIWRPTLELAQKERTEYQKIIKKEGGNFNLEPWDWRYYAEKNRKIKYDLDEKELKLYFELSKVKDGIFYVCNKLFEINFTLRTDIPKYHNDVLVYEVKRNDGAHVGILYMDFHPRESKRAGAWMNSYRKQYKKDNMFITPVITIVCNFTKPTSSTPSLLTFDEVRTFFHEFGHALHGLLSNGTYPKITGTATPRDFSELPAQIMEHWALHPEVLKIYARHFETNAQIPDILIEKIQNAKLFNQGFSLTEYIASAYLDIYWHTTSDGKVDDVNFFEKQILEKIGLIPEIIYRHRSTYFAHIFSGGYSSAYYSYIWCNVLDTDAFEVFKENGIFDKTTADSFRKNILEKGYGDKAMNLYKSFRGKEPQIETFLKSRGLE